MLSEDKLVFCNGLVLHRFQCLPLQPHPHSLGEHLTLCLIDQPTVEHSPGMASAPFSVALCHLGKAHRALPRQSRQSHQAIDRFRVAPAERQSSIPPREPACIEKEGIGKERGAGVCERSESCQQVPGLKDSKRVEELQNRMICCLRDHLGCSPASSSSKAALPLSRILGLRAELRSQRTQGLQRIFYLKLEDLVQPPPLIDRFLDTLPY
ncbi:Nuclear receptor subfamily 4 group A member 2 [Liparis tanakae]|uniref:Nuclear receptor subfamily 4 group A member 2 n=1 Tax=Liparis tanakae TaxID=230148 RepID=A0A4Z2ERT2_9TELE|nr:Nuclear receptor subfamily 4 group A member 2 [Liparis tanakae]